MTSTESRTPRPTDGLFLFFIALVLFWYSGGLFEREQMTRIVPFIQLGLVLLPTLLYAHICRFDFTNTFALRNISSSVAVWVALTVASGTMLITIAVVFQRVLFPWIIPLERELEYQFSPLVRLGTVQLLLLVVLMPAVCEEMMFRGFILKAFSHRSKLQGTLISSLLFCLLHLNPARFLPTFLLGVLLAYLVIRTGSLWSAIIGHAVHNSIGLTFRGFSSDRTDGATGAAAILLILLAAALLFPIGLRAIGKAMRARGARVRW